ncbi:MAG: helix-turn-helix domain-containing protein [Promethearchaeota archaeon]
MNGETHYQIAQRCGVKRETISRDLIKWRNTGGFEEWIEQEFFRLHGFVNSDPISSEAAYRVVAGIKKKSITKKIVTNLEAAKKIEYRITIVDELKTKGESNGTY